MFVHAPPVANTSPADGYQYFGELNVDGEREPHRRPA
jgi:alkaline phosphatase D